MGRIRSQVCAVAGLVALAIAVSSAAGQAPSRPLTKQQYFETSVGLMSAVDKAINRFYYRLALHRYPPKKCARMTRRFDGRLSPLLTEAEAVIPPAEIADIHADLMQRGGWVVGNIDRLAKLAATRRLVCGDNLRHPPPNRISRRISLVYERSGFDETLQALRDLGYVPSGY